MGGWDTPATTTAWAVWKAREEWPTRTAEMSTADRRGSPVSLLCSSDGLRTPDEGIAELGSGDCQTRRGGQRHQQRQRVRVEVGEDVGVEVADE